jgi:hypothetical protein
MITTVTAGKVLASALSAKLEKLAEQPIAQLSAMREMISRPDTPSWTADTIRRILNDRDHLTEIAAKSLAHPNGFDSIPLEVNLPHYRVRLHVWWPEIFLVTEDIHNHAWSFASRILSGELNFKTYRESNAGMPFFHYPWHYGEKGTYNGSEVERVGLATTFDACFTKTMYYSFDLNELHRVAPIKTDRPVATLVLTGKLQRNGSDVYTEKPRHGEGFRLAKERYTPDQLAERLLRLIDFL